MSAADLSSFFIMLREGVEAALVVGILLAYLRQVGGLRHAPYVWGGFAAAAGVSVGILGLLQALGAEFEGATEQVFEGATMVLAVCVLTWMIFWMMRQSRLLRGELQQGVDRALASGAGWGLFLLTFFAVVREGVEAALFLKAIALASGEATALGATLGLIAAAGVGTAIYVFGVRIDLRAFFRFTSVVLVLFAAGLLSHAADEFTEAGFLPAIVDHVWSTAALLPEDSGVGSLLRALFGYSDAPSLLEALTYGGYLVLVVVASRTRFAGAVTPRVRVGEKRQA